MHVAFPSDVKKALDIFSFFFFLFSNYDDMAFQPFSTIHQVTQFL